MNWQEEVNAQSVVVDKDMDDTSIFWHQWPLHTKSLSLKLSLAPILPANSDQMIFVLLESVIQETIVRKILC